MVIDYLPRIPRIPYSDRPHGPKIEPSITGAPLSSRLLLLLLFLLPSPPPPLSSSPLPSPLSSSFSLLFHPRPFDYSREIRPSRCSLVYFLAPRDERRIIPSLGDAALIKRALLRHLLQRNTPRIAPLSLVPSNRRPLATRDETTRNAFRNSDRGNGSKGITR